MTSASSAPYYSSRWASPPFKQIRFFIGFLRILGSLPLWIAIYYINGRENPTWNLGRTILIKILWQFCEIKTDTVDAPIVDWKLDKNWIGEMSRYVLVPAAPVEFLKGTAATIDSCGNSPTFSDVPAYWYSKDTENLFNTKKQFPTFKDGVLLYIHGGAFVIGAATENSGAPIVANLSKVGLDILSIDYRLAGRENSYPSQLQDAISAYRWLIQDLKYDPSKIIITGDSAGGNISIALTRYIVENGQALGLPMPAAALLISPWVDLTMSEAKKNLQFDYLPSRFLEWGVQSFANRHPVEFIRDPQMSPYFETAENLAKFLPPRVFVTYGGIECFRPEIEVLINKIRSGRKNVKSLKNEYYLQERNDGITTEESRVVSDIVDCSPHNLFLTHMGYSEEINRTVKRITQWTDSVLQEKSRRF